MLFSKTPALFPLNKTHNDFPSGGASSSSSNVTNKCPVCVVVGVVVVGILVLIAAVVMMTSGARPQFLNGQSYFCS